MGKPEGAKLREMKPVIHSLFPVGHEVGNQRKIYDAIVKEAKIEIGIRNCNVCDSPTHRGVCCGENTEFVETKFKKHDIQKIWDEAKESLDHNKPPLCVGESQTLQFLIPISIFASFTIAS